MLEHLVLMRISPEVGKASREEMTRQLLLMKESIPEIQDLCCGPGLAGHGTTYDYGMQVTFQDRGAFEAYQANPHHTATLDDYVRPIVEEVAIVDFEF